MREVGFVDPTEEEGEIEMAVYKRGEVWWYSFVFAGKKIQESAKTSRKTIATEAEKRRRLELERAHAGMPIDDKGRRVSSVRDR